VVKKPLISVVIPVGPRHGQHLPTALASIEQQTLPSDWIETIVVEDTGGRGASWARNEGIRRARAPLLSFLDADDYYTPTALEALLKGYAHYDAAYIYGDWWDAWDDQRVDYRLAANYTQEAHLRGGVHVISTLIATEDVRSIGGFDDLKGWEDWDFWCKMAVRGLCGERIPHTIIVYRIDQGFRRNDSYEMQEELKAAHVEKYKRYLLGSEKLMPCCTGNRAAKEDARFAVFSLGGLPMNQIPDSGTVRIEYLGSNRGPRSFKNPKTGTIRAGARNGTDQYANVDASEVRWWLGTNMWRLVPRLPVDGSNPPPPPVPHLVAGGEIGESASFTVPIDGQASPAPQVQFAPPPGPREDLVEAPISEQDGWGDAGEDPEVIAESARSIEEEAAARRAEAPVQSPGSSPKRKAKVIR
jgi:hypothetical protein